MIFIDNYSFLLFNHNNLMIVYYIQIYEKRGSSNGAQYNKVQSICNGS